MSLSVVAPVFNEEETLPRFYQRLRSVLEALGEPWDIIFVDDGSGDRSLALLRQFNAEEPRVRIVSFTRNFGHQTAITAGLDVAGGDVVVIIDTDLQDPPEVIPALVAEWRKGYEVVFAVRSARAGETAFKLTTAKVFYRLLSRIAAVHIPHDTGDFRLMDRRAVLAMRRLREHHRFMRGLSSWVGFRQTGVPYQREERLAGTTHYPLRKMFRLAVDAMTSFSYLPLQLASTLGFSIAGLSLAGIVLAIILRLVNHTVAGQATTLVAVLFIGGIQLMSLGIIGEYLGRIYDEVKDRPLYVVREVFGFEPRYLTSESLGDAHRSPMPTAQSPRPTQQEAVIAPAPPDSEHARQESS